MNYRDNPETSAHQGLSECNQCGVCCLTSPCLLVPKDVSRIAQELGESRREFSMHLQVELIPDGRRLVRMKNPCDFLDGRLCRIHSFKPKGGRDFKCWTDNPQTYFWREPDLRLIGFHERNRP
jgi:Fe-S-cluster containining protein